eukprot:SAG22_NODE_409_length_10939_cov_1.956638_7_plen_637_part_00
MPIGHTNMSMTFTRDIKEATIFGADSDQAVFMDCPGFLDNRGAVINIANAINVKLALAAVASARVVVLINYHSLRADRANGVRQLATMLLDLFGDLAGLQGSCGALLVGISQVPKQDEDGDDITFDDVLKELTDTSGLPPMHKALIETLSKSAFTFDLLNQAHESWLQREGIIAALQQCEPIERTGDIFKTVLTLEDEQALRNIVEVMAQRMEGEMKQHRFDAAAMVLQQLAHLSVIDNVLVTQLLTIATQRADTALRALEASATHELFRDDFPAAEAQLVLLDRAAAALRHIDGLGGCAARAEQVHAHLGRRRAEKVQVAALDAQIRKAAHDNALLQGQLQQVQANQRRAAEQYRTQVAELQERMEVAAADEREKAEVLRAGFDAQQAKLEAAMVAAGDQAEERQRLQEAQAQLRQELARREDELKREVAAEQARSTELMQAAERQQAENERQAAAQMEAIEQQQRQIVEAAAEARRKAEAEEAARLEPSSAVGSGAVRQSAHPRLSALVKGLRCADEARLVQDVDTAVQIHRHLEPEVDVFSENRLPTQMLAAKSAPQCYSIGAPLRRVARFVLTDWRVLLFPPQLKTTAGSPASSCSRGRSRLATAGSRTIYLSIYGSLNNTHRRGRAHLWLV